MLVRSSCIICPRTNALKWLLTILGLKWSLSRNQSTLPTSKCVFISGVRFYKLGQDCYSCCCIIGDPFVLLLTGVKAQKLKKIHPNLLATVPTSLSLLETHLQYQFDDLTWYPNQHEPSWSPTGSTMVATVQLESKNITNSFQIGSKTRNKHNKNEP